MTHTYKFVCLPSHNLCSCCRHNNFVYVVFVLRPVIFPFVCCRIIWVSLFLSLFREIVSHCLECQLQQKLDLFIPLDSTPLAYQVCVCVSWTSTTTTMEMWAGPVRLINVYVEEKCCVITKRQGVFIPQLLLDHITNQESPSIESQSLHVTTTTALAYGTTSKQDTHTRNELSINLWHNQYRIIIRTWLLICIINQSY